MTFTKDVIPLFLCRDRFSADGFFVFVFVLFCFLFNNFWYELHSGLLNLVHNILWWGQRWLIDDAAPKRARQLFVDDDSIRFGLYGEEAQSVCVVCLPQWTVQLQAIYMEHARISSIWWKKIKSRNSLLTRFLYSFYKFMLFEFWINDHRGDYWSCALC